MAPGVAFVGLDYLVLHKLLARAIALRSVGNILEIFCKVSPCHDERGAWTSSEGVAISVRTFKRVRVAN